MVRSSRTGRPSRPRCRSQSARCCTAAWSRIAGSRVTDISTALFVLEKACEPRATDVARRRGVATAGQRRNGRRAPCAGPIDPSLRRARRYRSLSRGPCRRRRRGLAADPPRPPFRRPHGDDHVGFNCLDAVGTDRDVAITPDGSRVVYRGNGQLVVRALNQLEPTVLSGLGAPQGLFVSPDGQWVGYFDGTTIKKVAITGGSPITIASVVGSCQCRGVPHGVRMEPSSSRRPPRRRP